MNPKKIYEYGLMYHHYANTAYPLTPQSFLDYKIKDYEKAEQLLKEEWQKAKRLSLYVHVPFCKVRCKFCEYAVLENADTSTEDYYVSLLLKEIKLYQKLVKNKPIAGYDIGGGTPLKLSADNLKLITDTIKQSFSFEEDVIFSIETTPVIAAKEYDKLKAVYDMGYERISMGIQTISEKLLNDLGREGTTHIYEEAVNNIRKAGFVRFNIDLMYGFLNQTEEELKSTLAYAVSLKPEYITLYRNRYKGTKLEQEAEGVSLYKIMKQYRLAYDFLIENGYYANIGKNTFSNVDKDYGTSDYLTKRVIDGIPYIGMGLGAQSFGMDYLSYNEGAASKQLARYSEKLEKGRFPVQDIYALPKDESVAKMVSVAFYFGFVDMEAFQKRFQLDFIDYFKKEVDFVLNNKLMEINKNRIVLTERGADYINGVIPLFYSKRSKEELIKLYKKSVNNSNGEKEFLKIYDIEKYQRPSVAVDISIFTVLNEKHENSRKPDKLHLALLMIKRGEHPDMNMWALPGGFLKPDETVEEAAERELKEEAGISCAALTQVKTFSEPGRDKRGWIISNAFMALVNSKMIRPHSGEDAIDAQWFTLEYKNISSNVSESGGLYFKKELYQLILKHEEIILNAEIEVIFKDSKNSWLKEYRIIHSEGIAFDHAKILVCAVTKLREELCESMLAFELLPEYFTFSELQKVHEIILDEKLLTANFRRKMNGKVIETENMTNGARYRPAKLFKRN